VSENAKASRLYWWTAEYGLVGRGDRPRIYGAGLLSSIGEAERCLTGEVRKVPLSAECVDTDFDITRMQPQLFVARDFEHLFEVLAEFEASLACARGGDFGLEQAIAARTVNHLLLSDGLELTGRFVERVLASHPVAAGLATALARVQGPILTSRNGRALAPPFTGEALVFFGRGQAVPEEGPFSIEFSSGLFVTGFAIGGGAVVNLRAHLSGRPLDLPSSTHVFTSKALPSVAGGPADPETWDRWFGELDSLAQGDGEARARAEKARSLDLELAALYEEVRELRERGTATRERLQAILEHASRWPGDWLLRSEVEELMRDRRHAA
jgi:phenylalanine-4-hydroxylase